MKERYRVINGEYYFQGFCVGSVKKSDCRLCLNCYELVGINTVNVCRNCNEKGFVVEVKK